MGTIMIKAPDQVTMVYREIDGQHTFRSTDYFGVYVIEDSLKEAFDKVVMTLEAMVKMNTAVNIEYGTEVTFEEFEAALKIESKKSVPHPSVILSEARAFASV